MVMRSGEELRLERERRKLRQADVAEMAGLSSKTISRIERGEDVHGASIDLLEQALDLPSSVEDADPRILNRRLFEFGRAFRKLRRGRNISPIQIRNLIGVDPSMLSRFERGLADCRLILEGGAEPVDLTGDGERAAWGFERQEPRSILLVVPDEPEIQYELACEGMWRNMFGREGVEELQRVLDPNGLR